MRTFVLVLVLVLGATGCVERRLFIRCDPPGARVFLDGEPRGEAPCALGFTYYGTREVVLRAEGRKPRRIVVELAAPWYQWTPVDFFAEVLWPFTIRDDRSVEVKLEPAAPGEAAAAEVKGLRERAEGRRKEAK